MSDGRFDCFWRVRQRLLYFCLCVVCLRVREVRFVCVNVCTHAWVIAVFLSMCDVIMCTHVAGIVLCVSVCVYPCLFRSVSFLALPGWASFGYSGSIVGT